MANKHQYIASILDKIYLGDGNYIFIHSFSTEGSYDEETHTFTDRNGLEYLPTTNPDVLQTDATRGFNNLEPLDKLQQIYKTKSLEEAEQEYDTFCSKYIFYVGTTEDNIVFTVPIDYIKMKENVTKSVSQMNEKGVFDQLEEGQGVTLDASDAALTEAAKEESDEEPDENKDEDEDIGLTDSYLYGSELPEEVKMFLSDLVNRKFLIKELKEIRGNLVKRRNDLDAIIDRVDLQMDIVKEHAGTQEESEEEIVPPKQSPLIIIPNRIDIDGIHQKMIKTLIAQDVPSRRVLVEIARKLQSKKLNERGLLITGQTGCGKTKMIELIARYLDRPFLKIDSTQLTIPGYVGRDIEEELWKLLIKCGKDVPKAEQAIVYFEEIDKKGSSGKGDVNGRGVLNVMLPFFDGSTYNACANMKHPEHAIPINSKNMIVLLGGAFEDVYNEIRKRKCGFGDTAEVDLDKEATPQDFVKYGEMTSEFMGRVDVIKLNDMNDHSIRRVILESDESCLLEQEKLFAQLGTRLTATEGYLGEIVGRAVKRKTGCRGIDTEVDESTWVAYDDAYTHPGLYSEIILDKETVGDPRQYKKVFKTGK